MFLPPARQGVSMLWRGITLFSVGFLMFLNCPAVSFRIAKYHSFGSRGISNVFGLPCNEFPCWRVIITLVVGDGVSDCLESFGG